MNDRETIINGSVTLHPLTPLEQLNDRENVINGVVITRVINRYRSRKPFTRGLGRASRSRRVITREFLVLQKNTLSFLAEGFLYAFCALCQCISAFSVRMSCLNSSFISGYAESIGSIFMPRLRSK